MGNETEINLDPSNDSESALTEPPVDTSKTVPDEDDNIPPLKNIAEPPLEPAPEGLDNKAADSPDSIPKQGSVDRTNDEVLDKIAHLESGALSDGTVDAVQPDSIKNPRLETAADTAGNINAGLEDSAAAATSGKKAIPSAVLPKGSSLDGSPATAVAKSVPDEDNRDATATQQPDIYSDPPQLKADTQINNTFNRWSLINKISSCALAMLITIGVFLYYHPALIGLTRMEQIALPQPDAAIEAVAPVPQQVAIPSRPGKREQVRAQVEDAFRLRKRLLEKKGEIFQLDLHYRDGITELEENIYLQIRQAGISTYEEAIDIRNVELNLRTIQRRQAYIRDLKKPAFWLQSGSEELLYLARKAQLDMQLSEVAGGIDWDKHLRHISAAIHRYQPSPDKLAIDALRSNWPPLDKIWQQVSRRRDSTAQLSVNPKDKVLENLICSGNFERVGEMSDISLRTAGCLARMKGSALFLNSVTTLSSTAAKRLLQWDGNWLCLNGLKKLSATTAQLLFSWQGKWLSLNSLAELPPEQAKSLLKWEGQQLELMGLKYVPNQTTQKTLKYLSLWETMGGKLFVSNEIRQEMENLL